MTTAKPPRTDFSHVPVTFSSYLTEQLRGWETLFPAEQSYLTRLSRYLEQAPKELFANLEAIEQKMGVTADKWPRGQFTLEQVDFLNRNAHYPEWRAEISRLFARIDPILHAEIRKDARPRLVVVIGPADLPVGPDRMWTRLADKGRRIPLAVPDDLSAYLPLLLTGSPDPDKGRDLAAIAASRERYASWAIETSNTLAPLIRDASTVRLSYDDLEPYRLRLMSEVQRIVEDRSIKGPRELSARLRKLRLLPDEAAFGNDEVLSEFVRATLLAGNGTLLINNTFVEWATVQSIRRARPDVLIVGFGIRNKVKPFSSLLIFHDQEKATAIPNQADMLGSYVDLEVFYQYIWQETTQHPEYPNNTAFLLVGTGMDEMQIIAPLDFPLAEKHESGRFPLGAIYQASRAWIET